jgi:predicted metal-dependent peptidase
MVTAPFPYLAGLAAATRVDIDDRVPTMGVFESGRMVANAAFVNKLNDNDLLFVIAHELLHLALRTHDRSRGSDRLQFNYAHDYIINDILRAELGRTSIPAGGLDMPGARTRSAEEILLEMKRNAERERQQADGDVLEASLEREWFPESAQNAAEQQAKAAEAAAKALSLAKAMGALRGMRGVDPGTQQQVVGALRGLYRTPWELALQRWIESVAPGERTFTRPSRRGGERDDIVLPGRRRQGWMLNLILDTSGSMANELAPALGAIADFCDTVAVDKIRIVQCDAAVTADHHIDPMALKLYPITGYGGSDLTPAMRHLADDRDVRAVLIVTDGDIAYPPQAMAYEVLWVLPPSASTFNPRYGRVLRMEARSR